MISLEQKVLATFAISPTIHIEHMYILVSNGLFKVEYRADH